MRNRVAEHVAALPKSGIRKFFDIVAQSKDIVSLGVGEPDFDTPWHISRAAVTCLENGGTHYTSNLGTPELRQAICRYLERRFCAKFDWKCEVLATVGVSEAIDLAIRAICSPGDEVLYHEPCFVSYAPTIRLAHAVPVCVETRVEDEFRLTVDALEKKVTPKTKAVLLNFPCNPTGATLSRGDMAAILGFCEKHDLPFYGLHSFRHLFASLLVNQGVDIVTVSGALGHSTVSTTSNIYCHMLEESRAKVSDAVSAALDFTIKKKDDEKEAKGA